MIYFFRCSHWCKQSAGTLTLEELQQHLAKKKSNKTTNRKNANNHLNTKNDLPRPKLTLKTQNPPIKKTNILKIRRDSAKENDAVKVKKPKSDLFSPPVITTKTYASKKAPFIKFTQSGFECCVCNYQSKTSDEMRGHFEKDHPGKLAHIRGYCGMCKLAYGTFYSFDYHVLKKHAQDLKSLALIPKQPKVTKIQASLDTETIECKTCEFSCALGPASVDSVIMHVKYVHFGGVSPSSDSLEYYCSECEYATNKPVSFKAHMHGHTVLTSPTLDQPEDIPEVTSTVASPDSVENQEDISQEENLVSTTEETLASTVDMAGDNTDSPSDSDLNLQDCPSVGDQLDANECKIQNTANPHNLDVLDDNNLENGETLDVSSSTEPDQTQDSPEDECVFDFNIECVESISPTAFEGCDGEMVNSQPEPSIKNHLEEIGLNVSKIPLPDGPPNRSNIFQGCKRKSGVLLESTPDSDVPYKKAKPDKTPETVTHPCVSIKSEPSRPEFKSSDSASTVAYSDNMEVRYSDEEVYEGVDTGHLDWSREFEVQQTVLNDITNSQPQNNVDPGLATMDDLNIHEEVVIANDETNDNVTQHNSDINNVLELDLHLSDSDSGSESDYENPSNPLSPDDNNNQMDSDSTSSHGASNSQSHKEVYFSCKVCPDPRLFPTMEELQTHKLLHTKKQLNIHCSKCDATHKELISAMLHYQSHR